MERISDAESCPDALRLESITPGSLALTDRFVSLGSSCSAERSDANKEQEQRTSLKADNVYWHNSVQKGHASGTIELSKQPPSFCSPIIALVQPEDCIQSS